MSGTAFNRRLATASSTLVIARVSPAVTWLVFVRPLGRSTRAAFAARTVCRRLPSETITLLPNVSTPELPPGVGTDIGSVYGTATSVYEFAPTVTVNGFATETACCTPLTNAVWNPRTSSTVRLGPALPSVVRALVLPL